MATLIHNIAAITAARYGVNILEEVPPGGVRGVGSSIVAAIGDFPWGPVDTVTSITSPAQLFETFAPLAFDVLNSWPALKAFINKTFPNTVKVVRVSTSSQAAATRTFQDGEASPADSVVVTARYPGAVGNQIRIAWTANADTAGNRDATVTIGTKYSATYKNVVVDNTGSITVTDPGDPFVTFAAAGSATDVPAVVAATALATGADGTPVAGDYTDGIDKFADASVDWNVMFVADPADALIDTINAYLKTFTDTHDRGIAVLCTPAAQVPADTITDAASYRSDRLFYPWPLVKTANAFDPDRDTVTLQGGSFAAAAIASVEPWASPGGAGGAQFLRGITGLEQGATFTELANLNAAGVAPFFMSTALEGAIIHRAVTTSLTAGLTKLFRRRMTDYLVQSIAGFLEQYVERPLDLDLANEALGPITGPEIGQIRAFLQDLQDLSRIKAYAVDPFGGNTASNINAGQWIILIAVQLNSMQEEIVLRASIGEGVDVAAVAA